MPQCSRLVRPSRGRGDGNKTSDGKPPACLCCVHQPAPVRPEEGESDGEQERRRLAPVGSAGLISRNILEAAKYTVRIPQYSSCKLNLFDFRYNCQDYTRSTPQCHSSAIAEAEGLRKSLKEARLYTHIAQASLLSASPRWAQPRPRCHASTIPPRRQIGAKPCDPY